MDFRPLLSQIVQDATLHARFLNTLSRMEYVGARKIFKSRDANFLDREGLQHALEETGHALRLKRYAEKICGDPQLVKTYSDEHTLAGSVGEDYIQGVDAAAHAVLSDLEEPLRTEVNYLLSSVAIEIRADSFYPMYEECLQETQAPFSVASIQKDEVKHLAELRERLSELLPHAETLLSSLQSREQELFEHWMQAIQEVVHSSKATEATLA